MQQHHRDAIERWAEAAADRRGGARPGGGRFADQGVGLADSDVDGFVIVTDEAFDRRRASGELTFFSTELCDYEGGYVDAKYVDRAFLEAVVERGSEAARSAFLGDRGLVDRPVIEALVHAATTYPKPASNSAWPASSRGPGRPVVRGRGGEARRPVPRRLGGEPFGAVRLPLVLAHNRVLYPYHKWLLRTVAEVPDRPGDFVDLVRALVMERTPAAAEAVVMSLLLFREWPQAPAGWSTQFMLDSEWNRSTVSHRLTIF